MYIYFHFTSLVIVHIVQLENIMVRGKSYSDRSLGNDDLCRTCLIHIVYDILLTYFMFKGGKLVNWYRDVKHDSYN